MMIEGPNLPCHKIHPHVFECKKTSVKGLHVKMGFVIFMPLEVEKCFLDK